MGRKKKSPQKANDAENKRFPLRRKIDAAKDLEQKSSKVSTSSVTVAAKHPAQKKTISLTTLNTVTPAGPARNVRSDIEYRELREVVDIINGKMDTVMDQMARKSIGLQENKNEVGIIKKELQNQREDFSEMKSTLADLGFMMKRAVELLERKEQNNTMATSVLEMSTVESENIFVNSNNEEMNGSVLEDEVELLSDARLGTITEESSILSQQSKNTVDTVTRRYTFSSEGTDPTVNHRTSLATERTTPTVTHRTSLSTERSTPTVTRRTTFSTGRDSLSSAFSTITIIDESQLTGQEGPIEASPLLSNLDNEEDSGRIKKQFNRLTCALSLINTPIGSEGERREGSLASLLCDSIRRRDSSLATSRLSDFTGESPASGRLTVSNVEVSEQMTSETRARRSSMDLAWHEKIISTRLTNDDSVVIQYTTPAISNHKTPDSVVCLGTPYRPTPPLINLVTSNSDATPRRTATFRARSSAMFDVSMNLQSARDALRRTNNVKHKVPDMPEAEMDQNNAPICPGTMKRRCGIKAPIATENRGKPYVNPVDGRVYKVYNCLSRGCNTQFFVYFE